MNRDPYYRLEMPEAGWTSGVQGAIEDSAGQVYFATPIGVQFCEVNGRVAGILNSPEHGAITDLVFAGKNLD
jgi:gluconolactonase